MARKKTFTREQFIEALKGLGAVESGRNAIGDVYMLGDRLRLVINDVSIRIQHYVDPEDSGCSEPYWSEEYRRAWFEEISQLPCDDEVYGRCFITSWKTPDGDDDFRVFHLF